MNSSSITRRRLLTTTSAAIGGAVLAGPAISSVASAQDATPTAGGATTSTGSIGGQIKTAYNPPATLNPLFSTTGIDQGAERQIYGALVMMTDGIDPEMDLAESVDVSPDG